MEIGKRLAEMRTGAGLSQRALGRASSVSYTTIARIETNSVTPDTSTIKKLANALGVTLIQIIEGNDTPEWSA